MEDNHSDLGPEPWKIFSHAVEVVIRQHGNLTKEDKKRDELIEYYNFVTGETNEIIKEGVRYTDTTIDWLDIQ